MAAKWYYTENGESIGPATSDEIVRRIEQFPDEPHLIWTEDVSGLTAAPTFPEAPTKPQAGKADAAPGSGVGLEARKEAKPSFARRARTEAVEYLAISTYLAICFGALLFYKAPILESEGVEYTRIGLAIVKALILGKFVLLLESLRIGGSGEPRRVMVLDILRKALLFTLLLAVLTAAEDMIVGYFHGEKVRDALKAMGGGTLPELSATALLMFLILIPYFAFREIAAKLGEGALSKLLFSRESAENQA